MWSDDSLRFLYFVDTVDGDGPRLDAPLSMAELMYGCTWYLVRDARPLMGSTAQLRRQVSGPLHQHGASSRDWLGVPMMRDGQVRGVVVVQSYVSEDCYTDADRALLGFVADHILTALERKRGQEELERRVAERTRQLAEANRGLQRAGPRARAFRAAADQRCTASPRWPMSMTRPSASTATSTWRSAS